MRLKIAVVYCSPLPHYKLVVSARACRCVCVCVWILLELLINQANEMLTKAVMLLKKFYYCICFASHHYKYAQKPNSADWKNRPFKWKSCLERAEIIETTIRRKNRQNSYVSTSIKIWQIDSRRCYCCCYYRCFAAPQPRKALGQQRQ